jgi:hypothetical protein
MHLTDPFGNKKEYAPEKIIDSVKRAGFSQQEAGKIEEQVRERVEDGMRSRDLYRIVYDVMTDFNEAKALRYRLREAIGSLKPERHEFEQYICTVLAMEGFDTAWSPRPLPQGACSTHEIDVVAEQDDITFAVECKHHFHYHRLTGMQVPMVQWAVLDDLQAGHEAGVPNAVDVDRMWVIVNTKLSQHAKDYAECKGIRMTAWDYPDDNSLRQIVERNRAYPITILRLDGTVWSALSEHDILTVQELLDLDEDAKTDIGIANDDLSALQRKARRLLHPDD